MINPSEDVAEAILRERFPEAQIVSVWLLGGRAQVSLDEYSIVRDTFDEALAWYSANWRKTPAAPVAPDPRDDEMQALQKRIAELEARKPEVKIVEVEKIVERIVEIAAPVPEPDPEPEHHFADLMLADETIDDARARLSQRLRELRHYLIAPEIKVNEDGSVGLTAGEQAELQDLERRQTLGRWLDA